MKKRLGQKIKKLRELGYIFAFSKSGATIGEYPKQIVIGAKITVDQIEEIIDNVLEKENKNPVFTFLEQEQMIQYV